MFPYSIKQLERAIDYLKQGRATLADDCIRRARDGIESALASDDAVGASATTFDDGRAEGRDSGLNR